MLTHVRLAVATPARRVRFVVGIILIFIFLVLCLSPRLSVLRQPALPARVVDLSQADAPFIAWPLTRVCNETSWHQGLVFECDNNSGGIGNIRNYILTCLRYAIEAGATGLIMPRIRTRSDINLESIMQEHRNLDYFFDPEHFRRHLLAACPAMEIFEKTDDIPNIPQPSQPERMTPHDIGSRRGCDPRDLNRHADIFGRRFKEWMKKTAYDFNRPPTSWTHPRVIRLNWGVQWDYPVLRDGPEFVATFGGLLQLRDDLVALGREVVSRIREQHGQAGFAGMHLRTESDALANWPNYDAQSSAYLDKASALGFKVVYLATGNATEAAKLRTEALVKYGIVMLTKESVLETQLTEAAFLQSLTWDQQALVDFVVLLESQFFMGVSPSSFSLNVALKRHLRHEGLYTRPWKIGGDGDGRSWLVGNYESYWTDWLFMYESLWP